MSLWKGLKTKKTLGKAPTETPKRELKAVISEYHDLVANSGERFYKMFCFGRDIFHLFARIDQVQAEAAEIQKEMQKQASTEAKTETNGTTSTTTTPQKLETKTETQGQTC